jgi:hypothetical protein
MSCDKHSAVEAIIQSLQNSVQDLYKRITLLEISYGRVDEKLNTITSKLENLIDKVNKLGSKPGENWDKLIWIIISGLASSIVTYFATRLIGK